MDRLTMRFAGRLRRGLCVMLLHVPLCLGVADALRAQTPPNRGEALYLYPAGFETGSDETVSPDGRLALFYSPFHPNPRPPTAPLKSITLLVDLQNGRVLGRGEETQAFDAWGPDLRRVYVEKEKTPGDQLHLVLDCLDIPGLSRIWTIPHDAVGIVCFGHRDNVIIAEAANEQATRPPPLNLELISRRGARRRILTHTFLLPVASLGVGGATEIVCENTSLIAAPLELLRADGSNVGTFGPPIPMDAKIVYVSATKIAWQQSTAPPFIALRHGQRWVVRQIRIPYEFSKGEGWPSLERAGINHLMLVRPNSPGGTTAAWSVNWNGVETRLHWPKYPETDDEVIPWIDGKHLVIDRVTARRIDFVDGETGKVERSFREAVPPPGGQADEDH